MTSHSYLVDEIPSTVGRKACFRCGEVKPLTEFYRHPKMADGHLGKCKPCTKADVKANRGARPAYYEQYDRMRWDRDGVRGDATPEAKAAAKAAWAERNKEKRRAHSAVQAAVKRGSLVPGPCATCGRPDTEAHHEDYAKPLDVVWLCTEHHGHTRRKERKPGFTPVRAQR